MDINSVIDNLCSKFGTTAACLIPEMARYNIAIDIIKIVSSLLGTFIAYKIFRVGYLQYKADINRYEDDKEYRIRHCLPDLTDYTGYWVISGILWLLCVVCLLISLCDCVGWIASPTAAFTKELLSTFRGGI